MEIKEFYKSVEDIILYPGNLKELNRLEQINGGDKSYELMPQNNGQRYLTGTIIPGQLEFEEAMTLVRITSGALSESDLDLDLDNEELGVLPEMMEQMTTKLYGKSEVQNLDLRLKAKKIGANGLIHIQMYNKDGTYMGVPVKLKQDN